VKQFLVSVKSNRPRRILYLCAATFLNSGMVAQDVPEGKKSETGSGKTMSVQVSIYLLDLQEYQGSVLPAYRAFAEQADSRALVGLIQSVLPQIRSGEKPSYWPSDVYEGDIAILTGRQYYSSKGKQPTEGAMTTTDDLRLFVDNSVAPFLVELFCLPRNRGLRPKQNMSGSDLMSYLYSQSPWAEDYFGGSKRPTGPVAEIKIGEWSQFFTKEEILAFDAELLRITRPENKRAVLDDFDNLRALVHAAASDPNLTILFLIS
jgi:hypothetical protein